MFEITFTWGLITVSLLCSLYFYSKMIFFKTLYQKTKIETSWLKKMTESASDTLDIYDFELEKNISNSDFLSDELKIAHQLIKELRQENSRLRTEVTNANKKLDELHVRLRNLI